MVFIFPIKIIMILMWIQFYSTFGKTQQQHVFDLPSDSSELNDEWAGEGKENQEGWKAFPVELGRETKEKKHPKYGAVWGGKALAYGGHGHHWLRHWCRLVSWQSMIIHHVILK